MLLRRVIGDVLRARRQHQHRTLREVSTAANVSLGYLSEIERGQKEASSELLASICEALGSQLSDVLRDASETLALSEGLAKGTTAGAAAEAVLVPAEREPAGADAPEVRPTPAAVPAEAHARTITDGTVSVCVRRDGPLRTTLHAVRNRRPGMPRTAELTRPSG